MKLDKDQIKIVNSTAKDICVVAGAGSGKTTVLTERIRHLIKDEGIIPEDIVAITFTVAAADEMRERLSDVEGIDDMFIGTIHSLAFALLRMACPDTDYEVLSDEKFMEVAGIVCKKFCKKLTAEKIQAYIELVEKERNGRAKKSEVEDFLDFTEQREFDLMMRSTEDVENRPNDSYPESIYSWAEKHDILTFDNLIVYAKKNLGAEFQFPYIFVDEYQDVGFLEDNFIRALEAEHYFIVGDDWQSIYGFKGAVVDIFKSYVANPEWTTYHLDRNYRCPAEILKLAEIIISDDEEKLDKNVIAMCKEKGNIVTDSQSELIWHLKSIRKSKDYKNWFLLARTRKDINVIFDFCEMIKLPAFFFSREGLSKEEEEELLAKDAVKIATVHGVKGLESENVLLYGNFPVHGEMPESAYRNAQRRQRFYEERRIMYVGVTRTKNKLVLLSDANPNIRQKMHG